MNEFGRSLIFHCSGEPYKREDRLTIIPHEHVNGISIPHNQSAEVSICGSAVFKVGVKGTLDLYKGNSERIASLSWNGPWSLTGNILQVQDLNEDKFIVKASSPSRKGILGDLIVVVEDTCTAETHCVMSCATADMLT